MGRKSKLALVWVGVRQALVGMAVVALSLPPLFALCHALGVGSPATEALATLGGSVVLGFAGGGLIGALLARVTGGRVRWGRLRAGAAVAGLIWGLMLCSLALPLYLDDALDDVTNTGTQAVFLRTGPVLDHPTGALEQAWAVVGELAQEGVARLPALTLLGWTVIGPALVAPWETRSPRKTET